MPMPLFSIRLAICLRGLLVPLSLSSSMENRPTLTDHLVWPIVWYHRAMGRTGRLLYVPPEKDPRRIHSNVVSRYHLLLLERPNGVNSQMSLILPLKLSSVTTTRAMATTTVFLIVAGPAIPGGQEGGSLLGTMRLVSWVNNPKMQPKHSYWKVMGCK